MFEDFFLNTIFPLAFKVQTFFSLVFPVRNSWNDKTYFRRKKEVCLEMIHSARPTISLVVNIVSSWNLFWFFLEKLGRTYGQTDEQHVWQQWSLSAVIVGGRVDQKF